MEPTGDIPDRDEVDPELNSLNPDTEARRKAELVESIIENGGVAHLYLPHLGPGEDRHCYQFNTHVFAQQGVIYIHGEDEDHWIPAQEVTEIERHYEA